MERPGRQPVRGAAGFPDRLLAQPDQGAVERDGLDVPDPVPLHGDAALGGKPVGRLAGLVEHPRERRRVEVALV